MLKSPWIAFIITFFIAIAWLRINNWAASHGWVDNKISRKIIHVGTGPIFVICWLLFPDHSISRYLAAIIPGLITLNFLFIGMGIIKDTDSVQAISRTGDHREILRGPLYYGIVFVILTIVFWKESFLGIIALMMLCGGDGIADTFGRKIMSPHLPWSRVKTVSGSIAMFLGGWTFTLLVLYIFIQAGVWNTQWVNLVLPIMMIAFVCMLIESIPIKDIDNITVPITALVLGTLFIK